MMIAPEAGAVPAVPAARRRRVALGLLRSFTSPLVPDDYLEMVNPLWSARELRGRVVGVRREAVDAVSVTIAPGWEWPGHRAGQYVRLGVEVDGVCHWRAYSLTSEPGRADGRIAVTPKLVPGGKVSPYLCEQVRPGTIVRLGGVEGTFTLDDPPAGAPPARKLLFVTAGSGVTPVVSMLRELTTARARVDDVVHIHSSRTPEQIAFAHELTSMARREPGYRLQVWLSGERGRMGVEDVVRACPDWGERTAYVCGPADMMRAVGERWNQENDPHRLRREHFQPDGLVADGEHGGCGGAVAFVKSGKEGVSDGREPILAAGEAAGVELPYGCRMGVCHSCVGRLRAGRVRDLRTGRVHGGVGELVQTCINAPEGRVEIEL